MDRRRLLYAKHCNITETKEGREFEKVGLNHDATAYFDNHKTRNVTNNRW